MYSVIVVDIRTRKTIVKYTYPTAAQAHEAARDVHEVRVCQNHEKVVVKVVKESY